MSLDILLIDKDHEAVHWQNITHNLGNMAGRAGIYEVLWHPEVANIKNAGCLIEPLVAAIADMRRQPDYYKQFNASNGWGLYKHFLPWLEKLLAACIKHPNAKVEVSI